MDEIRLQRDDISHHPQYHLRGRLSADTPAQPAGSERIPVACQASLAPFAQSSQFRPVQ
ncbi:hypothetical protein U4960_00420 [Altererythrobacter sp. H2]|uniref:hypothetical protein n=1 Tax=Altererythrobacter sp. H2 TaxID=3108391 RepID=UPI002B4C1E89|nr:hypothetical protein [Altererythrobacter sp. H2]WRK97417.1 hypothetical protein U4960_00420 [Altererythrobacter sp. H2]